ncbi:MAG: family 10 glycosylhydrolase [Ruminococcus sp.]
MRKNKPVSILIAVTLLASVLAVSALSARRHEPQKTVQTAATPSQAITPAAAPDDMRGVWITYMELSMENEADRSEAAFRKKFEAIADDCLSFGFNTLIVQVRPFCDALYPSKLYPASHILTGEQGKSPGYDALKIMCESCRKRGLSLHAWINPYRVTASQTPARLSADNPYRQNPSIGIQTASGIILDPADEAARQLILDGVKEIVSQYPVDGIHFDDYFYPTDIGDADSAAYEAYRRTVPQDAAMDLSDWRMANVNLLVAETYLTVHRYSQTVVFGISPQGNLGNNAQLYADVESWCRAKGYLDYICPQLYFSPDNPALRFADALGEWTATELAADVKLYVGLAGYKAGTDADEGTWQAHDDILSQELIILNSNQKVNGFMLYSYSALHDEAAKNEMQNLKKGLS